MPRTLSKHKFDHADFFSPSGDGYSPEFAYDSEGELKLVGKVNVYESIQAHADECDLATLISRAINGDDSALNKRIGSYLDTVNMPTSLIEAKEFADNTDNLFASLSAEDQKAFLADPDKFFKEKEKQQSDLDKAAQIEKLQMALEDLQGKEVKADE